METDLTDERPPNVFERQSIGSFVNGTFVGAAAVFVAIAAWQWHGGGSLPGTDAIAYITSGVHLVSKGSYTNLSGAPELWFPPFYPILIGTASLGGQLDPVAVARVISAFSSLVVLLLTGYLAGQITGCRYAPAAAMLMLTANPIFQQAAVFPLSEATATALTVCGFVVWLRLPKRNTWAYYGYLGIWIGLSYLTRPEGLMLLGLWAVVDAFLARFRVTGLMKYAGAFGAAAAIMLPYVVYLHPHTGRFTLTEKAAVNLASGRATYFGLPREHIDPATLEMTWWRYDTSLRSEVRRYFWNAKRVAGSYWASGTVLLALPILWGFLRLWDDGNRRRFLWGGLCLLAYVAVLAIYEVKDRYLHATLPFLAIMATQGLVVLGGSFHRQGWTGRAKAAVATMVVLGLGIQISSAFRRGGEAEASRLALLRDAGAELRKLGATKGVVYEKWGCVAFHAGQETRTLTGDDIQTVLRYIDWHENAKRPVYLAVSSAESAWYAPSVKALLLSAEGIPRLRREVTVADERGRAVIYRVGGVGNQGQVRREARNSW